LITSGLVPIGDVKSPPSFFDMIDNRLLIELGIALLVLGIIIGFAIGLGHGSSQLNSTSNMTLQCVRMFYSDSWDKGYVVDLAKFCNGDIG
jgi:hypothetical protein